MYVTIGLCSIITTVVAYAVLHRLTDISKLSRPLTAILIISLFLPMSTTFLIPIDIFNPSLFNTMSYIWTCNYWITFNLTWFILPFWQYYLQCGQFDVYSRIRFAIISIFKYFLYMIIITISIFIYLIVYHRDYINFSFLKSLIITSSHIYSIVLAIWLMVHGLIHIPKHFTISYNTKLDQIYNRLPPIQLHLEDCKFELRELYITLNSISSSDIDITDKVHYMLNKIPIMFNTTVRNNTAAPNLIKLNEKLNSTIWDYNHSQSVFNQLVNQAIYLEDVVNTLNDSTSTWRTNYYKFPQWYYRYALPFLNIFKLIILSIISFTIIESELLYNTKFSIISKFINIPIFTSIILIFMISTSLKSLSLIKIFKIYNIELNCKNNPISTIFFVSYTLRIGIPLNYNYLMISNKSVESISFISFFNKNLKFLKFGIFLNSLIPRLIWIPILISLFGVWGKINKFIENLIGIDMSELNDEMEGIENEHIDGVRSNMDVINRGKSIVNSNISKMTNNIHDINSTTSILQHYGLINGLIKRWNDMDIHSIKSLFNRNHGISIDDVNNNEVVDGLRSYNLTDNSNGRILLDNESGYDDDVRMLDDDYIRNIS